MQKFILGIIGFFIFGCVVKNAPAPSLMMDKVIETETNTARNASHQLVQLGQNKLKQKQYAEAMNHFSKALETDAQNPFAYYYMAKTKKALQKNDEAQTLFEKSASLFSNDHSIWKSDALVEAGDLLLVGNRPLQAKEQYKKALNADPNNKKAREGLEKTLSIPVMK